MDVQFAHYTTEEKNEVSSIIWVEERRIGWMKKGSRMLISKCVLSLWPNIFTNTTKQPTHRLTTLIQFFFFFEWMTVLILFPLWWAYMKAKWKESAWDDAKTCLEGMKKVSSWMLCVCEEMIIERLSRSIIEPCGERCCLSQRHTTMQRMRTKSYPWI